MSEKSKKSGFVLIENDLLFCFKLQLMNSASQIDRIYISNCLGIYVYAYIAIYSLYQHIRGSTSSSEYSPLINERNNAAGYPIYSRC